MGSQSLFIGLAYKAMQACAKGLLACVKTQRVNIFFGQQEQFSSDSVINRIKAFSSLVVTELTQKIIFFLCRV